MKYNDFEEDRTRRGEKKDTKDNKKRENDLKRIVTQWPGGMRGAAGEDYRRV